MVCAQAMTCDMSIVGTLPLWVSDSRAKKGSIILHHRQKSFERFAFEETLLICESYGLIDLYFLDFCKTRLIQASLHGIREPSSISASIMKLWNRCLVKKKI